MAEHTPTLETPAARAYAKYDPKDPPPHPGAGWTRFVCISDTHSRTHWNVPPGDVLVHAGDLTRRGHLHQLKETLEWVSRMPHPVKIVIGGNHDACLDPNMLSKMSKKHAADLRHDWTAAGKMVRSEKLRESGVVYLDREEVQATIAPSGRRWRVYGDPGTPRYGMPSFQYNRGVEAAARYERIPDETEILVTHGPREGVLDATLEGVSAGCGDLRERVGRLGRLRLHVSGHLHEAHGVHLEAETGLVSVNCAVYWTGQAVIVDLID
ncbi:Metallo-dependent phosphatase [Exidia glandulosa HHB12029]|uniref:Metallo-dependent phosphatase n=1 Tax=Exidia glandulosa HHB12029 TaxID=1314781 RepID=A0A165BJ20_EXIGL|nr:Metallo-dependent phosphatase [Exidia glandulosa HHB12029]